MKVFVCLLVQINSWENHLMWGQSKGGNGTQIWGSNNIWPLWQQSYLGPLWQWCPSLLGTARDLRELSVALCFHSTIYKQWWSDGTPLQPLGSTMALLFINSAYIYTHVLNMMLCKTRAHCQSLDFMKHRPICNVSANKTEYDGKSWE